MGDKKLEKILQEAAYAKASKRTQDLIILYADKTHILFGEPKPKKKKS